MPASTLMATLIWLTLAAGLLTWAISVPAPPVTRVAFCIASSTLWITGLRAAALWARSARWRPATRAGEPAPLRIALLYCVADDIDLEAMAESMRQDVAVETVILDDSRTAAARSRLDAFAARYGCRLIRREGHAGYKAGNLNHGLTTLRGRFDAYLLCDSDVVLPRDFARVCAAALADPGVAIAQGAPVARTGTTWFARYLGPLLGTHVSVTRRGRQAHGVAMFLGRGALVRAAAIEDVGGVPEVVAEDLALTVALRRRGWRIADVDASFAEDYPVDYRSFRTQMRKTTEGAVEFLRDHLRPGRLRGMRGREARDLLLETALVPASALAGVVALVSGAVLAATGTAPPAWVGAVATAGAAMPLLPEVVRRARTRGLAAGVVFGLVGGALYASTMFVVLAATLRMTLGRRAVFWITPKRATRLGGWQLLELLRPDLALIPLIASVIAVAAGSPLFALAALGPLAPAVAFSVPAIRRSSAPRHPAADAIRRRRPAVMWMPALLRRRSRRPAAI